MNNFLKAAIEKIPTLQNVASKSVLERLESNPNAITDDFDSVGKGILNVLMPFIYTELRQEDFYNPYEDSGFVTRKTQPNFGLSAFLLMRSDQLGATDEDFMGDFNSIQQSTDWKHRAVKKVEARVMIPNIMYSDYVSVLSDWYYHTQFNNSNGFEMIISINAAIINMLLMDYSKFRCGLYEDAISRQSEATDLLASQLVNVKFADVDNITEQEAKDFVKALVDFKAAIKIKPSRYNEAGFNKTPTALKYFVHPGFKERLNLALTNTYNPQFISDLFVDMDEIPILGGTITTKYNGATVYPVYSTDAKNKGQLLGYATTEGSTQATIKVADVENVANDEDIIMLCVDEGRTIYATHEEEYSMPVGTYNQSGQFYNQWLMVKGSADGTTGAAFGWDKTKTYVKFVNTNA